MKRKPNRRLYYKGYENGNVRKELYSIISQTDSHFVNLADQDKIMYLLKLHNNNSSKIIAKYTYLMFQKRKDDVNLK